MTVGGQEGPSRPQERPVDKSCSGQQREVRLVMTVADRPAPARRKRKPPAEAAVPPQETPRAPLRKVLLTASPKGGTGKTTFSKNIAVVAAHMGYRVSVIDFDRQGTLSKWW